MEKMIRRYVNEVLKYLPIYERRTARTIITATIYERLKGDTTRPLLQTEDPLQKIKDMIAVREQKYLAAAHRVIEVDKKSIMEIIHEIIENDGINLKL